MNNPTPVTEPEVSGDSHYSSANDAQVQMPFAESGHISCPACGDPIELNLGDGEAHDYVCASCGAEFSVAPSDLYEHLPEDFVQLEAESRALAAQQLVINQQQEQQAALIKEQRLRKRSRWVTVLGGLATLSMLVSFVLNLIKGVNPPPLPEAIDSSFSLADLAEITMHLAWLLIFAAITLGLSSALAIRRKNS